MLMTSRVNDVIQAHIASCRWMGEARFTVEAVKKLLSFPIKSGKVWFAPLEEGELDFPTPTVGKRISYNIVLTIYLI